MRVAVPLLLGSSADETIWAFEKAGSKVETVWFTDSSLPSKCDLVVLPHGASYGNYLRAGAIAKKAPLMQAIVKFAQDGGKVVGFGDGFALLCELGLLDGALVTNKTGRFESKNITTKVKQTNSKLLAKLSTNQTLTMPIASLDSCFFADSTKLKELEANDQIALVYSDDELQEEKIAGVVNSGKNVLGVLQIAPRAADEMLGSGDGLLLIRSILGS